MIIAELIEELKKYPPDAEVGWCDHDGSPDEINDRVRCVKPFNPDESFDPGYCRNVMVVLLP